VVWLNLGKGTWFKMYACMPKHSYNRPAFSKLNRHLLHSTEEVGEENEEGLVGQNTRSRHR